MLAWLGVIGCAKDPDDNAPSIWCGAVCVAEARCGDTRSFEQCRADWVRGSPGLVNLTTGGATALAPCLEQLSCLILADNSITPAEGHDCWEQAIRSVEVTSRERSFCADYALVLFQCGASYPLAACERDYAMYASSFLDKLTSCARQPTCDAFWACDRAVKQPRP